MKARARTVASRGASRKRAGSSIAGDLRVLLRDLAAANRALAEAGVVDAWGHVSVRDPRDPGRYFISRSLAPALVTERDLVLLDLDSVPMVADGPPLYSERFIHGELYRARADVLAVVHHHSPTAVAFGVTTTPLRAVYHMSAFLGEGLPVWDIRDAAGKPTDMLVRTPELGAALARTVGARPAALMCGHGAVVAGDSLGQVVGRAIYMELNARIQLDAIRLDGAVRYLDPAETGIATRTLGAYDRGWELWKRSTP